MKLISKSTNFDSLKIMHETFKKDNAYKAGNRTNITKGKSGPIATNSFDKKYSFDSYLKNVLEKQERFVKIFGGTSIIFEIEVPISKDIDSLSLTNKQKTALKLYKDTLQRTYNPEMWIDELLLEIYNVTPHEVTKTMYLRFGCEFKDFWYMSPGKGFRPCTRPFVERNGKVLSEFCQGRNTPYLYAQENVGVITIHDSLKSAQDKDFMSFFARSLLFFEANKKDEFLALCPQRLYSGTDFKKSLEIVVSDISEMLELMGLENLKRIDFAQSQSSLSGSYLYLDYTKEDINSKVYVAPEATKEDMEIIKKYTMEKGKNAIEIKNLIALTKEEAERSQVK